MLLKSPVDLLRRWRLQRSRRGICSGVLSLWIATRSATGLNIKEGLVVVGVGTHVVDHASSNVGMLILVSVDLIRQAVEQTVS